MRLRFIMMASALALLTGCSFVDVPDAKSTTGRPPAVAEVPSPEETVRGEGEPPIVTLEVSKQLHERRLSRYEELPGGIVVPTTNLNAVPVTTALQAVLAGTDVSLSWDTQGFDDRLVSVTNLSGTLPKVVEKICASAKVFCSYRSGMLELKDKETFIVDLPAVPSLKDNAKGATNSMADMIGTLANDKVRIDQQGGNLVYTTDVVGQENVHQYLDELRHGRPLLVMQLYIWEVNLTRDHATGINWSSFSMPTIGGTFEKLALAGSTAFTSVTNPGVSLGATLNGKVSAKAVLSFLSTQGQVQTISSPQLSFVSGANAEFKVGGKQRYISEVGTSTSSVSTSTTSSNTVSTDEIETGLKVTVGGSYESGVVSALMNLEMQDVVSLNATTMQNGTTIDLPETKERKVSTSMRIRPGDSMVLAGLVSSRDNNSKEGIPLPFSSKLPTYDSDELTNTELVILVKPSIVLFADKEDEPPPVHAPSPKAARASGVESTPLPDPVLIDKDGSKPVALPANHSDLERTKPVSLAAEPTVLAPVAEVPAQRLSAVPVQPSADSAPVDRSLMQRGFSHAYDEMLEPASGVATYAKQEEAYP